MYRIASRNDAGSNDDSPAQYCRATYSAMHRIDAENLVHHCFVHQGWVLTCMHMSASPRTVLTSTLTQPSAICEMQMRAAWRFFQSGSCSSVGSRLEASGATVFPPSASASLSRLSCPNSYSSPSPSLSYLSVSALCQLGSSCKPSLPH